MLLHIPAVLSADEVRDARARLAAAAWVDGRTTAGHRATRVKSNHQLAGDDPVAHSLGTLILEKLGVNPLFIAATLPLKVLPPRFNRYEGGGTYGTHVDNAIFPLAGTPTRIRSDISVTLFFSDPDDYDGGELLVQDTFGDQRVKLPAGDMVVYPGSSLHRVTPVTRGTRLASFFWLQSLVRSDQQRSILFDLDRAIQRLGTDHPGHESIDTFTGTYHNLLRQWAIT